MLEILGVDNHRGVAPGIMCPVFARPRVMPAVEDEQDSPGCPEIEARWGVIELSQK